METLKTPKSNIKKKNDKNVKRILCRNIITTGSCSYGTKCKYSHTLEEQIIDKSRKHAWDILLSDISLDNIDLQKDYQLYQTFTILTKLCKQCYNNECIGGYNCDHGVFDKKYQICSQDLNYGNCNNGLCDLIHLTTRGLKPWFSKDKIVINSTIPIIKGTLLSNNFFVNSVCANEETLSEFTDSSDDEYNITNNDDEYDISIFSK